MGPTLQQNCPLCWVARTEAFFFQKVLYLSLIFPPSFRTHCSFCELYVTPFVSGFPRKKIETVSQDLNYLVRIRVPKPANRNKRAATNVIVLIYFIHIRMLLTASFTFKFVNYKQLVVVDPDDIDAAVIIAISCDCRFRLSRLAFDPVHGFGELLQKPQYHSVLPFLNLVGSAWHGFTVKLPRDSRNGFHGTLLVDEKELRITRTDQFTICKVAAVSTRECLPTTCVTSNLIFSLRQRIVQIIRSITQCL